MGLTITGCSKKSDLLQELSGQWQDNQTKSMVEIHLVGDAKSMTIDGQSYPVTVEKVDPGEYQVNLKVQNGNAQPEKWVLRQLWNDNGSEFNLAFNHNGKNEVLISKGQS